LRIHTTIDRPVLLAGRRYTVDGLFRIDLVEERSNLLS
jgi:hypothetical protein